MRLVIKGSEWQRGRRNEGVLYDGDGRYCCLGIHARACGIEPADMAYVGTPEDLPNLFDIPEAYEAAWLRDDGIDYFGREFLDNEAVSHAVDINDDPDISDDERIERLRPLFKEVGVTLVWRPDL